MPVFGAFPDRGPCARLMQFEIAATLTPHAPRPSHSIADDCRHKFAAFARRWLNFSSVSSACPATRPIRLGGAYSGRNDMKALLPSVPDWLRQELQNRPRPGAGVHSWLFWISRQLHCHYPDKDELADSLEDAVSGCGRLVLRRELEGAVADSESVAWRPGSRPKHTGVGEEGAAADADRGQTARRSATAQES